MRARDVVGKTIARVEQERMGAIRRIVFTDGTSLGFSVIELKSDYATKGVVPAVKGVVFKEAA